MRIVLFFEGKTEIVFLPYLKEFLASHLQGNMPVILSRKYDGRIPTREKLRRIVQNILTGPHPADHVIALTDVYTGTRPPDFIDAEDAKRKMRDWVGDEPRFHPHAAQYEFEAWLLPYWKSIQNLAGHNKSAPPGAPETVNHNNPPARRIREIFEIGKCRDSYVKPRDAGRILRDNDLSVTINQCPELKSFINTIIRVSGGTIIA